MAQKKLHILKPDIQKGFLESDMSEQITFLEIHPEWDEKTLQEDIRAGAVQFKPVLEMTKKKPSRFVVLEAENEEQGYLAVSYLAGIYNKQDGIMEEDAELCSFTEEEDVLPPPFEDISYDDWEEQNEEGIWDDGSSWVESANRIPVITMQELNIYMNFHKNSMGSDFGGYPVMMNQYNAPKAPYWLDCTEEPVCILVTSNLFIGQTEAKHLQRFAKNRHVYVLVIHEDMNWEEQDSMEEREDAPFTYDNAWEQGFVCEVMLEYTARIAKILLDKDKKNRYYCNLFDSWLEEYQLKTEKGFPKTRIVNRILSMQRKDKSQLMEKVLLYVIRDGIKGNCLAEKDFEALDFFKVLSKEEEKQKKASLSLERDLVGMESVKQQIRDIISVMKYNKLREKMGIKHGSFHNVHMLIGAPGTAKTTVAEIMGNMMREERLLAGNRFISLNGADLKGMFVGHSAPKTKSIFDNNDIIFIDEAYSIASGDRGGMDSFSEEAIAQLIIELEKHATDRLVIFAGYGGPNVSLKDNKMKNFLDANPGIKSRINSTIYFESYTPEEMVEIAHRQAENMQFVLDRKADGAILDYFRERVAKRDFGNGREARSLVEQCLTFAARRVMNLPEKKITKKMMKEISLEDVQAAIAKQRNSNCMQEGRRKKCGFCQ